MTIEVVRTARQLREFIALPWRIYATHQRWVPPLIADVRKMLDRKRNPFFVRSTAEYFLARDARGAVVGRIVATRYAEHLEVYHDGTGFFGFFECVDDATVAGALFDAAADWLHSQGLQRMRGPASFTINDECGLLVEGHELAPYVMMPYNPAYYQRLFEANGFVKAQDLYAYGMRAEDRRTDVLDRIARLAERVTDFTIRPVDMSRFEEETEIFEKIYAEAWTENWGAVPMRPGELKQVAKDLKAFLAPEIILIAEHAGQPVGVVFALPNLNLALKKANGRLFPLGLIKILLEKRKIREARVVLLGTLKSFRRRGIEGALHRALDEAFRRLDYQAAEFAWILESNGEMNAALVRVGARRVKTYRFYDRALAAPTA